jgi:O-antigen ligase
MFPGLFILLGGFLGATQSQNPTGNFVEAFKTFYLYVVWFALALIQIQTRKAAQAILIAYLVGISIACIIAVIDFWGGTSIGYQLATFSGNINLNLGNLRLSGRSAGTMFHPNHLGEFTAAALPIAIELVWLGWNQKSRFRLILFGTVCLLLGVGNLLSGSVGGYIGLFIGSGLALILLLFKDISKLVQVVFLSILFIFLGLIILNTAPFLEPIQTQLNKNVERVIQKTGPNRLTLISDTWKLIQEKPITGVGMDQRNSEDQVSSLQTKLQVHNTFLLAWVGGGILNLVGIFLIYLISLKYSLTVIISHLSKKYHPFMVGLAASFIGWAVIDVAQPSTYSRYTWITVAVLIGLILSQTATKPNSQPTTLHPRSVKTAFLLTSLKSKF